MGKFLRDLDRSQAAVDAIIEWLHDRDYRTRELPRDEQYNGDIEVTNTVGAIKNIEVKYDIMSAKTGNLCFELSNGKKPTGIYQTKADWIFYASPLKDCLKVFVFTPTDLIDYVENSSNVVIKQGGDKKKFKLALVKMSQVDKDSVADAVFTIGS